MKGSFESGLSRGWPFLATQDPLNSNLGFKDGAESRG